MRSWLPCPASPDPGNKCGIVRTANINRLTLTLCQVKHICLFLCVLQVAGVCALASSRVVSTPYA